MSTSVRSAREVVELYNYSVWNDRNFDLLDELLADQIVRHGVGDVVTLTKEQALKRVEDFWKSVAAVSFTLPVVIDGRDDEHVAIVYQADITGLDGSTSGVASIEVFHVVGGRITEVWNNPHQSGNWC